jgi:hypothetical protein
MKDAALQGSTRIIETITKPLQQLRRLARRL